jgi:ribosomal protein S27AE
MYGDESAETPLSCPACGAAMNHHAEKLATPLTEEDARRMDPSLGGVVVEAHTCPACGMSAAR